MRYSFALAAIPALMWAASLPASPPLPVKPVATEGVTARRMDDATFRVRWRPLHDLAPATVIHEMGGGDAQPRENASKPVEAASFPPPARLVRRAALRPTDVCARHGLRRITYSVRGYQHWRCRR